MYCCYKQAQLCLAHDPLMSVYVMCTFQSDNQIPVLCASTVHSQLNQVLMGISISMPICMYHDCKSQSDTDHSEAEKRLKLHSGTYIFNNTYQNDRHTCVRLIRC